MDLDDDELKATRKLHGLDKSRCLHCGEGEPGYCENCYQELIGLDMEHQRINGELREKIKELETMIDDMADDLVDYFHYINKKYGDSISFTPPKNIEEVKEYYKYKEEN